MLGTMGRLSVERWQIAAVSPISYPGDLRAVRLEIKPEEGIGVEGISSYLNSRIHLMLYGPRLRTLLKESWDIVHCWEEPYVCSAAQIAYWTPKETRFVFYTFQNIAKSYLPPFSWFEQYCVSRCAGWLAAGSSIEATLLPRGYDRRPHRVTPLAVDTSLFCSRPILKQQIRKYLGWDDQTIPVVGFLGRFISAKGVKFLAGVLDQIRTPWRALFVGGGELESWITNWAKPYGDRVRIITSASHDQVPGYLNAMDLLCAPSQTTPTWREQFGRMVIEAFACGVPVLASDSGELPYVVGQAGIAICESNQSVWIAEIGRLFADSRVRADFAARGLDRVNENYTLERVAKNHLAFFEEILDGSYSPT